MELELSGNSPVAAVPAERRGVLRIVFSFPVVLGALLVVLTIFTVRDRFNDPDMWWHLKTGEIIWTTHSIPRVDIFSYTAPGRPWIAQEWLAEVSIYGAYKLGGYSGLMVWLCLLASMIVVGAYLLSFLCSRNSKVSFLGGLLVWLLATVGFAIRPHLIGYLLLLCELAILHLGRRSDGRWFFLLPPLFALWINCHSSFIFGVAIAAATLVCAFWEREWGPLILRRWDTTVRRKLVIALGLSMAALFVNPIGPKLIWYPIDVMVSERLNIASVSEWQPIPLSDPRAWTLLVMGALIVLVPLLRRMSLDAEELIVVAIGFGLAIQHQRMLAIFAILTAPVLCRLLASAWENYDPNRDPVFVNVFVIAVATIVAGLAFPNSQNLVRQVERANPVKAVQYLASTSLAGRMLNEYVYGGYLIWAAPERRVFIDGRADLYDPAGVLAEYGSWATLQEDPRILIEKYGIQLCLLSTQHPMSHVMPLLAGWKTVYSDSNAVLFARQP